MIFSRLKISSLFSTVVLFGLFTQSVQAVSAADIEQILANTFASPQLNYQSRTELSVEQGGESDLPFHLEVRVQENGGKQNHQYSKQGKIWAEATEVQDLPSDFSDLTTAVGELSYWGAYQELNQMALAGISETKLWTDSVKLGKIFDMMNQFLKVLNGLSVRFSQQDLMSSLQTTLGMNEFGVDEKELLQAFSAQQSIDQMMGTFGALLDDLITTGVLREDMLDEQGRRRRESGLGNTHILTLGSSITTQQAKILQVSLQEFVTRLVPAMGQLAADKIASETPESLRDGINGLLSMLNENAIQIIIETRNDLIQTLKMNLDLNSLGVPLILIQNTTFDTSSGFQLSGTLDENRIIDLNRVLDGVMTISEMTQEAFYEPSYELPTTEFPGITLNETGWNSLGDEIQISDYLLMMCGYDEQCLRREARTLFNELKWLQDLDEISSTEARARTRMIRGVLRNLTL
ncbi:MAG: hypothetical protein Q8O95_01730 [bacterium]|nr:hypothetical protein [bacterium]